MAACSLHPVCYNGDIRIPEDMDRLISLTGTVDRVMVGRGLLRDPSLVRRLQGNPAADSVQLRQYHDRLYDSYLEMLPDGRQAVSKMKGIWSFWQEAEAFKCCDKQLKKLKKSEEVSEDEVADEEDILQKTTDRFIKRVDEAVEEKTRELMTI